MRVSTLDLSGLGWDTDIRLVRALWGPFGSVAAAVNTLGRTILCLTKTKR